MSRLIDADEMLDDLRHDPIGRILIAKYNLDGYINGRLTVEPGQKTGHWIDLDGAGVHPFWRRYECSACGSRSDTGSYCPHCGARMEENR